MNVGSAEYAFRIDEERAAESNAFVFEEDAVGFGGGMALVGELRMSNEHSE